MGNTDDYIIITGSRNLDDDTVNPIENPPATKAETEDASLRAMQKQGIYLERSSETPEHAKPFDEFSKELLEQSGIEIVSSEEEAETGRF